MKGFQNRIFVLFILLGTVFGVQFQEIHHEMLPEERLKVFRTAGTDVPPYEVVEIHSPKLHKRAVNKGQKIKLTAFGEDIEHYLTPLEDTLVTNKTVIAEMSSFYSKEPFITRSPVNINKISRYIYQNKQYAITLSIKKRRERREMSGYIGYKNWYVSPVPDRLRKSLNSNKSKRSISDENAEDDDKSFHIIYLIPNSDVRNATASLLRVQRSPLLAYEETGDKNSVGKTVYPQILVIVDYKLFEMLNKNMYETVTYVIAFWNGVDMMYRDLDDPPVRLNIACILISKDIKSVGYIHRNYKNQVLAPETLKEKRSWLFNRSNVPLLNVYDISLTMIGTFEMGEIVNGKFESGITGRAYVNAACKLDETNGQVWSVGIFIDVGDFARIRTAAHELGHLIGAHHDGEYNDCKPEDGAILTANEASNNQSQYSHSFSECSKEQFKQYLTSGYADCLWFDPTLEHEKSLPRILPGQLIDLEKQCQYGDFLIPVIEDGMCRALICKNIDGYRISTGLPAADGSFCGKNKICLEGYCVEENKVLKNLSYKSAKDFSKYSKYLTS